MLFYCLLVQCDDVRTTQISNNTYAHKEFDLLIADLPKGLPVLLISPSAIPKWNKHHSNELEAIFEFSFHFPHDDAHIFLFMPESTNV